MPPLLHHARNERGATFMFVGLLLISLLALSALAVDVGLWLNTRSEAQRVADSAALAGAGVFLYPGFPEALAPLAEDTARQFAAHNYVGPDFVDGAGDVDVEIVPDSQLVRVTVRGGTPSLFAWLFGRTHLEVAARAAARVLQGGSARCLKPFAVPDIWHDEDGDANGNRIYDAGEDWRFGSNPGDYYSRFDGDYGNADATGYGGPRRDAPYGDGYRYDYARELTIKVTDPNDIEPGNLQPSIFLPWAIPNDEPPEGECRFQSGGTEHGAASYRANICKCNASPVLLGEEYPVLTGNMVGPTSQGVRSLIDEDPDAYWYEYSEPDGTATGEVRGSAWASNWMESPRVVKLALFDPTQITQPGMQTITFNNFALFFIEEQRSGRDPVRGRFLSYVTGEPAPQSGSLVRVLQLVE